ncbi:MAG: NTPase [Candidatus Bathyarchaeia archaeon]
MRKRVFLLTGSPSVGKTTVLAKAVELLKAQGYSVGGMLSREVREGGVRVGFEILDPASGRWGWLAHVNQKNGPLVGKYRVNLSDLEGIGAQAILDALAKSDVVAVDEIGPMELFSAKFKEATRKALANDKPVLAVVHWKAQDRLVLEAKSRLDAETKVVTMENRELLPAALASATVEFLERCR